MQELSQLAFSEKITIRRVRDDDSLYDVEGSPLKSLSHSSSTSNDEVKPALIQISADVASKSFTFHSKFNSVFALACGLTTDKVGIYLTKHEPSPLLIGRVNVDERELQVVNNRLDPVLTTKILKTTCCCLVQPNPYKVYNAANKLVTQIKWSADKMVIEKPDLIQPDYLLYILVTCIIAKVHKSPQYAKEARFSLKHLQPRNSQKRKQSHKKWSATLTALTGFDETREIMELSPFFLGQTWDSTK